MIRTTEKMKERWKKGLRKYKPVVKKAIDNDLNESDTVVIITDILCDVFGYNKYTEITSEYAIRKTFCDLAIKIDEQVKTLIEVKSIGTDLNTNHLRQAANYGANAGINWVILTNGQHWKVYYITFGKKIDYNLVFEFNFTELTLTNDTNIAYLALLSRETVAKSNDSLKDFYSQKALLDKIVVSQILLSEPVIRSIKNVMKKMAKETKVENDEIINFLTNKIIKRELLEDEKVSSVKRSISRALK